MTGVLTIWKYSRVFAGKDQFFNSSMNARIPKTGNENHQ